MCWQIQIICFLSLPFFWIHELAGAGQVAMLKGKRRMEAGGLEKDIPGTDKATWKYDSLVFMQAVSMPAVKFCVAVSGEGCHPEWWDIGLNSCTQIASGRKTLFSLCLPECKMWRQGCLLFLSFTANIFSVTKTNLSPERPSLKLFDSWETVSAVFDFVNTNR